MLKAKFFKVLASLVMVASSLLPVGAGNAADGPRDKDVNAVFYGGAYSVSELCDSQGHFKSDGKHSASTIAADYAQVGATCAGLSSSDTHEGVITRTGNVIVNGTVVATDVLSAGRVQLGPNDQKVGDVYWRPPSESFRSPELSAWVNMAGGVFHWAVMHSCGNMVKKTHTPPPASVKCDSLTAQPNHGAAPLPVSFKAVAEESNAKITSFKFNFGNGETRVVPASVVGNRATAQTNFTYNNPGRSPEAFVLVNSDLGTTDKTPACSATITTNSPQATFACLNLTANGKKQVEVQAGDSIRFDARGEAKGARVTSFKFNFDNGDTKTVAATQGTNGVATATTNYAYQNAGPARNPFVLVETTAGTTKHVAACEVSVLVKPNNKPPVFACTSLTAQPMDSSGKVVGEAPFKVKFTAKGTATRTTIESYNYNFDANLNNSIDLVHKTSGTTDSVFHTYSQPGNYTATVQVKTGAGTTKVKAACSVHITVVKPPVHRNFECLSLTADQTSGSAPLPVNFTAKASVKNTTVQAYKFDFGDGKTAKKNTSDLMTTISHTYQQDGDYLATVQVNTKAGVTPVTERCEVAITVKTPPGQGGGGTPPSETPPGEEIPATGAGALGFASLGGLGYLAFVLRKRNLLALLQ